MSTAVLPPPTAIETEILRQLRQVRYGALEVQVHDGRVMQIERRERLRPDEQAQLR